MNGHWCFWVLETRGYSGLDEDEPKIRRMPTLFVLSAQDAQIRYDRIQTTVTATLPRAQE